MEFAQTEKIEQMAQQIIERAQLLQQQKMQQQTQDRPVIGEATALEITKRQADGEDLYFIINFKDEEIPLPAVFDGKEDILTGEKVQGGEMLKKYDLRIVSVPRV